MKPAPSYSARGAVTVGLIALAILVGGFGSWSVLTRISGAVIAPGKLEVEQNRQVVQHPDGGVVAEVLVNEGQHVEAGQVLLRLDPEKLDSELAITEGQLWELMARRGRLEAERDGARAPRFDPEVTEVAAHHPEVAELIEGQRQLFSVNLLSYEQTLGQVSRRIDQIGSQIDGIDAQYAALDIQLGLISQELTAQSELLDKGLSQLARVLSLRREQARLQGSLGDLTAQRAEAQGKVTEYELHLTSRGSDRRQEAISALRDQQYRELELQERRRSLKGQLAHMDLTAPVSGVVYGQTVFAPRSVLKPAEPVLYLVPQDRPLIITARVDPIHVDALHIGRPVVLRFSAFDRRTTPELNGHLTLVSADAFTDEATGRTYYKAEIAMNDGERDRLPEELTLIPGMPVEAFIRTDDRTPLAYLVKPVTDYLAKAFREG